MWVDDTYEVKVQAKDGTLALTSDIPAVPVKQVKLNGAALTPDASGAVNVNALTAHQSLTAYCTKAELKTALASVGQIPSGDGANLENAIAKFNALFSALSALTD